MLSLLRQGLTVEVDFGTHSLEALVWVAETVEEAVYVPGSLTATPGTLRFALANPPLRVGAFGAVRAAVDGRPVAPECLRLRYGPGRPWRTAREISPQRPLELAAGQSTEIVLEGLDGSPPRRPTIRLELESVAIPPLVWLEFADEARPGGSV